MRRILLLLLAASSAPALAQHTGHAPPAPPPAQADPHAGHEQAEPQAEPPVDPHADHRQAGQAAEPDAADRQAEPAADPHAGHRQAEQAADPHAGHRIDEAAAAEAPPVAPPPPEAFAGPDHAADAVFGATAMAEARAALRATHGDMRAWKVFADRLEVGLRDGDDAFAWEDVGFWYGGDIDRLWIRSEGEGVFGEGIEQGDVQALWSHAIDPWFDLQAGVRLNFGRGPERPHLVLGLQGLAPYWFEIDAAAFLSSNGDLTGRLEAEYDQRITQRLILQPRVEASFSLQDVPELAIGSGLSAAEAGLRLRYEIVPEFAPYVGVHYQRSFGDSADFRRAAGEEAGGWTLVLGTKLWF